jgi:hypothetical protein
MVCPFSGPVYPRANGDQSADITRLCLSDKRSIRCVSPNVAHLRHAGMSAPWSLTGAKRTSGKLCSIITRPRNFPIRGPTPYRVAV